MEFTDFNRVHYAKWPTPISTNPVAASPVREDDEDEEDEQTNAERPTSNPPQPVAPTATAVPKQFQVGGAVDDSTGDDAATQSPAQMTTPAPPVLPSTDYDSGGQTGPGATDEPAGIVHRGEFVETAAAVDRYGTGVMESLRSGTAQVSQGNAGQTVINPGAGASSAPSEPATLRSSGSSMKVPGFMRGGYVGSRLAKMAADSFADTDAADAIGFSNLDSAGKVMGAGAYVAPAMIAKVGIESLAKEVETQYQEEQASNVGDVAEYQKLQKKEYSGITGSIREEAADHPIITAIATGGLSYVANKADELITGRKQETPEQQKQELQQAIDQKKQDKIDSRVLEVGERNQAHRQREEVEEKRDVIESETAGAGDKAMERASFRAQDLLAKADQLDSANAKLEGYHNDADGMKGGRTAAQKKADDVATMRQQANEIYVNEAGDLKQEKNEREGKLRTQVDIGAKEAAGDVTGAIREKFEQGLRDKLVDVRKSGTADEAQQFQSEIMPQLQKQFDDKQAKELEKHDQSLDLERDVAEKRTRGDVQGAERDQFEAGLQKKSEEAHTQGDGDKFDKEVAPALQAEFDKKQNDERVASAQETEDKITAIQEKANDQRLRAAGESFEAEKEARFAAIDAEIKKTQEAADKALDLVDKAGLQKIADATKSAGESEKKSFTDNVARVDDEQAEHIQEQSVAKQMRKVGMKQEAEDYLEAVNSKREVKKLTDSGETKSAAAAAQAFKDEHGGQDPDAFIPHAPAPTPPAPVIQPPVYHPRPPEKPFHSELAAMENQALQGVGPDGSPVKLAPDQLDNLRHAAGGADSIPQHDAGSSTSSSIPPKPEQQPEDSIAQWKREHGDQATSVTPPGGPAKPEEDSIAEWKRTHPEQPSSIPDKPIAVKPKHADDNDPDDADYDATGDQPDGAASPSAAALPTAATAGQALVGQPVGTAPATSASPSTASPAPSAPGTSTPMPSAAQTPAGPVAPPAPAVASTPAPTTSAPANAPGTQQPATVTPPVAAAPALAQPPAAPEAPTVFQPVTAADRSFEQAKADRGAYQSTPSVQAWEKQREAHRKEVQEHAEQLRGSGRGVEADYDELREHQEENIDKAKMTGDPKQIEQAKKMAAAEIKAFIAKHGHKADHYEIQSTSSYLDKMILGDVNGRGSDGTVEALRRAGKDSKSLGDNGRGDLRPDDGAGKAMTKMAEHIGETVRQLNRMLANAPKLHTAGN